MAKFLEKPTWSEADLKVFLKNIELLRKKAGLKISELNEKVDVANLYRKGTGRLSRGTILSICRIFNVTEDWLESTHYEKLDIRYNQIHEEGGGRHESMMTIDLEVLTGVIKGAEDYLRTSKNELEPETKARLVALLYDRFAGTGEAMNEKMIVSYLKLVA
ncbi:MAG: helix-turn-helix domain-containing protein [Desulfobacterales bacterium]|nr:helix-turn-helix domain-containing protein [Desulfobacterales bacterium]